MTLFIMKELQDFIESGEGSRWIYHNNRDISIYVRRRMRVIDGQRVNNVLDIANFEVSIKKRRQGLMTNWLREAEKMARDNNFTHTFVESILNPHVLVFLRKEGYIEASDIYPPCMYKVL